MSTLRSLWLGLALAAGCGFQGKPGAASDDASLDDASDAPVDVAIDSMIDSPPVDPNCYGTGITRVCLMNAVSTPLRFFDMDTFGDDLGSLDTTPGAEPLCAELQAGQPNFCVIAGTSISIERRVGTYGPRPILFLATEGGVVVIVNSGIDAASGKPGIPGDLGPGSGLGPCGTPTVPGIGGGGAGGTLRAAGGPGGAGVGAGGMAAAAPTITALRGGCPGRAAGGAGGLGGGALGIVAATTITVDGFLNASGGGGLASTTDGAGGAGGGSGGMIVLDAPSVTVSGKVFAEGGGGAGGNGALGNDGDDGGIATETVSQAPGGMGGGSGGNGGNGSTGNGGQGGGGGAGTAGGGGGGGGAGVIRTTDPTPQTTGTVSPAYSP